MANTHKTSKVDALTSLLKLMSEGKDPRFVCEEAKRLAAQFDPRDIAAAGRHLIEEGYPCRLVQQLSATLVLMALLEKHGTRPQSWLPANHILRIVMAEHDLIRCFLADLNDVVEAIQDLDCLTDVSLEFRKLAHIIEHLNAMKEHIGREEDVIFPCLRKQGCMSFCPLLRREHASIVTEIDSLVSCIVSFNKVNLEQFKIRLITCARRLISIAMDHLFQEDNTLFPVALGAIKDAKVWRKIRFLCDQLGYCGVHL